VLVQLGSSGCPPAIEVATDPETTGSPISSDSSNATTRRSLVVRQEPAQARKPQLIRQGERRDTKPKAPHASRDKLKPQQAGEVAEWPNAAVC
jgi:hypothetical protein